MDLLKKLKIEQELEERAVGQRTLLGDAELQELEEKIQYEAGQRLAEHDIFVKEIEGEIKVVREYLNIHSWKKALEILKHRFDDKKTPNHFQQEIHRLYFEAQAMMEEAN